MRAAIWVFTLAAIVVAEIADEPWVEEEDLGDQNDYDDHDRSKRETYVEGPFEEHIRIKRRCEEQAPEKERKKRSAEYVRRPRQVHQYEVHEATNEAAIPSPPFEEMLAASAEHYHKVYLPAPKGRSLNPELKAGRLTFGTPVALDPIQLVDPPALQSSYVANVANTNEPLAADSFPAAGNHHQQKAPHTVIYSQGGGHQNQGHHYNAGGGKNYKGSHSDHYVDKGQKGHKKDENHRKEYEEAAGKKKKHHDRANHKGSHEEEAFGQRGAHFGEKKAHKKGHKTKGYHNKYHKDEFHKEHKFYDDYHKGGEHHRFGKFNAKHASNESGKKKASHVNAGHDFVQHGKKGYSNKGHLDADHNGHKAQKGHEEHHQEHSQHGKKGGKQGSSQWGYAKKN
ncbi:unnamed protein product [Danaus chrysippus]|uniref:(African queen) hypothetical protein n=1 Tax=Danaus chrysippus TaxID=151541 RepID=A0A8J2QKX5_9NEOP|nr:unnamed protein product [Danaus chrysippus]